MRQDSTFWSLRQMLNWERGEKLLAVIHFIHFLRILQKLSNILQPSRWNWTTKVWFFLQMEDNWWKFLSQLLLTSYFFLVCLNWKLLSAPYIIPPCIDLRKKVLSLAYKSCEHLCSAALRFYVMYVGWVIFSIVAKVQIWLLRRVSNDSYWSNIFKCWSWPFLEKQTFMIFFVLL